MFFCCEPWEEIKRRKYYSKPRKCPQCKNIGYLNYNLGLCNICTEIYLDYLNDKIDKLFNK